MEAARREELKALFEQALDLPPYERPAFLDAACASQGQAADVKVFGGRKFISGI